MDSLYEALCQQLIFASLSFAFFLTYFTLTSAYRKLSLLFLRNEDFIYNEPIGMREIGYRL